MTLFELLAFGFLATLVVMGLVFFGVLAMAARLVGWVLFLPFQLFAWLFGGLGFVIGLPFVLLGLTLGAVAIGIGAFLLFVPVVPFLLLAGIIVWMVRRGRRKAAVTG